MTVGVLHLYYLQVLPRLKALGLPARTLALDYGLAPATSHATALTHCLHAWQKLAAQLRKEDLEDEKEAETGAAGGTPSVKGSTISSSNRSSFSSKDRSTIQGASVNRVGFGRGTKVVLCGDSAGGHLVIALTKQLRATAAAASDTANTFSPTPAAQKVDLAAVAEERAGGAGAEPVLLPAALVALSPWLQLTSPPQEKDGDTKPDILSPAMVNSFVADLVSGHRAEK
jgi:acetyl esterase/lipase